MKKTLLLLVFLCLIIIQISASNRLIINSLEEPVSFNGQKFVLIQKGDDPAYKEPGFDDSAWTVTSLPMEWAVLYPDYNGICWYRLHFLLPEKLPAQSIGLGLGIICDADEVFLNGHLIAGSGVISGKPVSAYDKKRIYELPPGFLKPGEDNLVAIRIRGMFTYMNGPYTGNMKIDKYINLLTEYYKVEIRDLIFVIIYVVVGVYFLFFYIRRRQDMENLFFAFFCFGVSAYFFFRTQFKYLLDMDFFVSKKIEYIVLTFLVYILMEFFIFYFKKKHKWFHFAFLGLNLLTFFIILFTNDYNIWDKVNQYLMVPSWIIGVIAGFYVVISKLKSELDARFMFFSSIILFASFLNDIMVNLVIYKFIRVTQYGFFFFIGSIAIILSNRFVRLHNEVADLNINLEQKVLTRTDELNQTVEKLAAANEETNNILRNVQEGIFLIDKDYMIGHNYSKIMEIIFEKNNIGGITLPKLLSEIASPEIIKQVEDFLEIVFTRNLPSKRLQNLNPLEEVDTHFILEQGNKEKFLNFAFTRISAQDGNVFILATVRDVTERKKLTLKIKKTEEQAEKDAGLLTAIIHLNPELLRNFLKESQLEIQSMEELLKKAQFSADLKELLKVVYTSVHTIKGDAGMLAIKALAGAAHEFENSIKGLFNKPDIQAVELINLPYGLAEIKTILLRIETIIKEITQFRNSFGNQTLSDRDYIAESLKNTASRVAERENKQVRLDLQSFRLPPEVNLNILAIKRILLQIVKNSVAHGIDLPAVRQKAGKPSTGRIIVKSEITQETLTIKITDDGGNLDTDRIRQSVLKSGKYLKEDIDAMSDGKAALLIFDTGISTRENLTIDAGRGIGLDIVKDSIKTLGGKISIAYKTGKYTQFRFTIPL